eukprot:3599644-Rhodomonas_salina.2
MTWGAVACGVWVRLTRRGGGQREPKARAGPCPDATHPGHSPSPLSSLPVSAPPGRALATMPLHAPRYASSRSSLCLFTLLAMPLHAHNYASSRSSSSPKPRHPACLAPPRPCPLPPPPPPPPVPSPCAAGCQREQR